MRDWTDTLLDFLGNPWTHAALWTFSAFVLGSIIGSFANVCLVRWPLGLSVNQPPSHCFGCQKPIAWYDNLPLLSFLWLRARCRHCQICFSSRYFWIELAFATVFALVYFLEVVLNVRRAGLLPTTNYAYGLTPSLVAIYGYHAFLLGTFLISAFLAWQGTRMPWGAYVPALMVGLVGGIFGAWPWPCPMHPNTPALYWDIPLGTVTGLQPAPPWTPLPASLPPNSYVLGLMNVVAGSVAGLVLVGFLQLITRYLGDTCRVSGNDLLLGAVFGAFLGWQGVVLAVVCGLILWLVTIPVRNWLQRRGRYLPLGTWLGLAGWSYLFTSRWILSAISS